jgi:drug/metabolite transporter (DMT)-like permease
MGKKGMIEQESPMNVVYRKKDQLQFQNKERNGEHIHPQHIHPLGIFPLKWFFLAQSYDFAQLLHTLIRGLGFATVLLVMFNKAALSSYEFPCANVITVMQMILSTVVLYVLRKLNLIKFSDDSADGKTAVKHFVPVRVLRQISPLSIAYLFYMVVGMASIRGVNVPMYTTLRRTTVFFTIIMEFLLVGQKHSNPIIASVAIIVLGAFVAGSRDLSFELEGYSTVLLSNITTAIYLATIARLGT